VLTYFDRLCWQTYIAWMTFTDIGLHLLIKRNHCDLKSSMACWFLAKSLFYDSPISDWQPTLFLSIYIVLTLTTYTLLINIHFVDTHNLHSYINIHFVDHTLFLWESYKSTSEDKKYAFSQMLKQTGKCLLKQKGRPNSHCNGGKDFTGLK